MATIDVGENIRNARKRAGLNQEELAELARLNRVTVAKYESGKVEPGAQALSRIADVLEVTVNELLGREAPDETQHTITSEPVTHEAKILSAGVDKMPEADRKRILKMVELMFEQYKDYFEGNDDD